MPHTVRWGLESPVPGDSDVDQEDQAWVPSSQGAGVSPAAHGLPEPLSTTLRNGGHAVPPTTPGHPLLPTLWPHVASGAQSHPGACSQPSHHSIPAILSGFCPLRRRLWNVLTECSPGQPPPAHKGQDGQRADKTHAELWDWKLWPHRHMEPRPALRGFLTTLGSSSLWGERGPHLFPTAVSIDFHWAPGVILTTAKKKFMASEEPKSARHSPAVLARLASLLLPSPGQTAHEAGADRELHVF